MEELTVPFTLGGSASAGEYTPSAIDSVTIPAGEDSVEVTITPVDDTEEESDKQVTLTLSPPAGGECLIDPERSAAFVTIIDDDDPDNSAPVAVGDFYAVVHDRILEVPTPGVLANDSDADGDDLEVILTAEPSNGSINYQSGEISFYQGTGYFQYSPELSFVGTDSFSYRVWDGTTLSEEATVTISVTNHAPVGAADSFTIGEDQVLSVTDPPGFGSNLLTNDTDADDDVVWAALVTGTANGSLVLNPDGTFDYTPEPNFTGTDKFTYSVTDGIVGTLPVEVTITVEPGGPFDIDGWDLTTETTWMSPTEEVNYGLHADMQGASKILSRAYNLPDDWVIDSRRVDWDPNTLSVGGATQPGYFDLDPDGSEEVFSVSAVREGYGKTYITYSISGTDNSGPLPALFVVDLVLGVVEQKAVLVSVDFKSVHQMYSDTGDIKRPGPAYNPNIPEYIQRAGRTLANTPVAQSWDSKISLDLTWRVAGVPNGTPYDLFGTKLDGDDALKFESKNNTVTLPAENKINLSLTTVGTVGKKIRKIRDTIDWKMVLNPGAANEQELDIKNPSGPHTIYVIFGTPSNQENNEYRITPNRLDRAVEVAKAAYEKAEEIAEGEPTWQRIVFQLVHEHVFKLGVHTVDNLPLKSSDFAKSWEVPDRAQEVGGSDCISGAVFVDLVINSTGIPGVVTAAAYRAKDYRTVQGRNTAVEVTREEAPFRFLNGRKVHLGLLGVLGDFNAFEAAVVYTPPGADQKTFYFPVGTVPAFAFDNKDHVIKSLPQLVFYDQKRREVVQVLENYWFLGIVPPIHLTVSID